MAFNDAYYFLRYHPYHGDSNGVARLPADVLVRHHDAELVGEALQAKQLA